MENAWFYTLDGKSRVGPLSLADMREQIRTGRLAPSHMVHRTGMATWAKAETLPELFPPQAAPLAVPVAVGGDPFSELDPTLTEAAPRRHDADANPVAAVLSYPRAAYEEGRRRASLFALRRRVQKATKDEDQFLQDLGVCLLSTAAVFPGSEELAERFRQLSQAHQLAQQGVQGGDKTRRREAASLAEQLRLLYTDFGRRALQSTTAFTGRREREMRWQQIQTERVQTQQQLDDAAAQLAAVAPRTRKKAAVGLAACLALLGLVCLLAWWMLPSGQPPTPIVKNNRPETARGKAGEEGKKPAETVKAPPRPRTRQELFLVMAPAVPLLESPRDGGTVTGSGFLVKQANKYLVVTNAHVIKEARRGVIVHFLPDDAGGEDNRLSILPDRATVVAIHKTADLALLDVTPAKAEIDRLHIQPVVLAPARSLPRVGDDVFAIGHPGGGALTRTLGTGIVSSVNRQVRRNRYLQVTVPLNPGNSGGPLIDMEGRVVGVNTFIIRGTRAEGDTPLEALNFALQMEYVHELLSDPSKSMDDKAIAAYLRPPTVRITPALALALKDRLDQLGKDGYKPVADAGGGSTTLFRLEAGEVQVIPLSCEKDGLYALVVVSEGVENLDLAVLNKEKSKALVQKDGEAHPDVKFKAPAQGVYLGVVRNPTDNAAQVAVIRFQK